MEFEKVEDMKHIYWLEDGGLRIQIIIDATSWKEAERDFQKMMNAIKDGKIKY